MSRFKGWDLAAVSRLDNRRILDANILDLKKKKKKKKNKYGSVTTVYDGQKYDSKLEANYAHQLDWRLKAGDILRWERQIPIPLSTEGKVVCTYKIDFLVFHLDGRKEYVEVKGKETDLWKLKWKLFKVWLRNNDPTATARLVFKDKTEIIHADKC